MERHKIQAKLRELMPGYDPKKSKAVDFDAIKEHIQQAESRARILADNRVAEGDPSGNPSTTFFKLSAQIRTHGK